MMTGAPSGGYTTTTTGNRDKDEQRGTQRKGPRDVDNVSWALGMFLFFIYLLNDDDSDYTSNTSSSNGLGLAGFI